MGYKGSDNARGGPRSVNYRAAWTQEDLSPMPVAESTAVAGTSGDPFIGDLVAKEAAERKRGGRPAKGHVGYQRKIHCQACGFIAYATRGALQRSGFPRCGCGQPLTLANLRDRAAVEWDALKAELLAIGRDAYERACRELGYTDLIGKKGGPSRSGRQSRCEFGTCTRWTSGVYCDEHKAHRPEVASAHRGR